MSTSGVDWDRAREVVEPAVDEVARKILAAGGNVGLLGAALAAWNEWQRRAPPPFPHRRRAYSFLVLGRLTMYRPRA